MHPLVLPDDLDRALVSEQMLSNPFPVYERLRKEFPVAWSTQWNAWIVSRYDHVEASLKDKEHLSNENRQALLFAHMSAKEQEDLATLRHYFAQKDVIGSDPPDHTRMRNLVQKAFTPKMVAGLRPRIEALAEELLQAASIKAEFDFVEEVAHPLPVILIAEMMGAPVEDRPLFKRWSADILSFQGSGITEYQTSLVAQRSLTELFEYTLALIEARRKDPKDDLITTLAFAEDQGQTLHRDELLATCNTILTAGHETTTNLIGNVIRSLMLDTSSWEALKADPTLIANAIEESLRIDAPKQRNFRRIKKAHTFEGVPLEAQQMIFQLIGSANRDPEVFDQPDRFHLYRTNAKDHLSFGIGIHFCLGASLARMEASVVIEALLRWMPHLRLSEKGYTWQERQQFRGPGSLWLKAI